MTKRMQKIDVVLTPELKERIQSIARTQSISASAVMKIAAMDYLIRHEQLMKI